MAVAVTFLIAAAGLTLPAAAAPGVPEEPVEAAAEPQGTVPAGTTPEFEEFTAQDRSAATESGIGLLSVPNPPSGHVVISVRVSGDRIAGATIQATGLAGVTLRLSSSETNANSWSTYPWATCISDADGDCNFVVPIRSGSASTSGMQSGQRPWVHPVSAPSGWHLNPQLRVGSGNGSGSVAFDYRFRLDQSVSAGSTYRSTSSNVNFLITSTASDNRDTSAGYWQIARDNPPMREQCGMDVALLLDLSASIGSELPNVKRAANAFIDGLAGTPSRVALFSFDGVSPASGSTGNVPALRSVRTTVEGATVKNTYGGSNPNSGGWSTGSGTNWDAGLYAVGSAAPNYDVVVVVTDGNPTQFGTSQRDRTDSSPNRVRDTEAGVFSANLVKSRGTRVVAVGVGSGAGGLSDLNLRAISGSTVGSDYFQVGSYTEAATTLAALAKGNCEGSIDVVKRVIPATATVPANPTKAQLDAISAPASGWVINATSANPAQVTIGTPAGPWTTNAQGHATVPLKFPKPQAQGPITFTETQKPGYELQPVRVGTATQNAVCVNTNTNVNVTVTNAGTAAAPGASLPVAVNTAIECTVYNRLVPPPAALATTKAITRVNSAPADASTFIKPGDVLRYSIVVSNTGGVAGTTVLTETIPTGTRYTGTGEGWTCATPAVAGSTCTMSVTVNAGASVTSTFTVTADTPLPAALTQIRNVVRTSVGTCATCEVTNPVTPPADLATGKVLTQVTRDGITWAPNLGDTVRSADVLVYTVSVQNAGGLPGTTVLTETVPPGTTFIGGSGQGWTCAASPAVGGTTCTQSVTVQPGATATRTFTVVVNTLLPAELASIRNVVTSSVGTCTTCTTTNRVPPQWSLAKTALRGTTELERGATVQPGEVLTYRVTATNASANAVTGVMLVDDLSGVLDDATFVAGSAQLVIGGQAPIAVANPAGTTLSSPIFVLPATTTAVLTYRVTVDADAWSAELRNVVIGHGDYPPATCAPPGAPRGWPRRRSSRSPSATSARRSR